MNSPELNVICVAFVGCAGVPNRYGGFESFVEHCGPAIARQVKSVTVTCDSSLYAEQTQFFEGMHRVFVNVRANGAKSVLHDLLAFVLVFRQSTHIVVLGVSGGIWFPFFRCICDLFGKRLLVNVDGLEWRRTKFSRPKRMLLRLFDALAQRFAHTVIYDNAQLHRDLWQFAWPKAMEIAYAGNHIKRLPKWDRGCELGTALTICRIEPENNLELLIQGALISSLRKYSIVGNWTNSQYGRRLKERYASNHRLALIEPIYEPHKLVELRENCEIYLHGHSVGGTNPSLVEMLFYDCKVFCFDVPYNRETAGAAAQYFNTAIELATLIATASEPDAVEREAKRAKFSVERIAAQYLAAMAGPKIP